MKDYVNVEYEEIREKSETITQTEFENWVKDYDEDTDLINEMWDDIIDGINTSYKLDDIDDGSDCISMVYVEMYEKYKQLKKDSK